MIPFLLPRRTALADCTDTPAAPRKCVRPHMPDPGPHVHHPPTSPATLSLSSFTTPTRTHTSSALRHLAFAADDQCVRGLAMFSTAAREPLGRGAVGWDLGARGVGAALICEDRVPGFAVLAAAFRARSVFALRPSMRAVKGKARAEMAAERMCVWRTAALVL
eukprot:262338-Rhodomonas_salina.1